MRQRLDQILVVRGLAPTRARARDLILRGEVRVAGEVAQRASKMVDENADLAVNAHVAGDVSRGAAKLRRGLDAFGYSAKGIVAADVGASTGGFTQVLLAHGATRVYAIDVGHGQLSGALKSDGRVVNLEGVDIRHMSPADVPEHVAGVVIDVSFISLRKVLPAALTLTAPGAWLVALIKPQFEVGPDHVGKGGIVRDDAVRDDAVKAVRADVEAREGWQVADVVDSPIAGGDGNLEFLIGARRDG